MIAVIGATGRSGAALARELHAAGAGFVPVLRDPGKWAALGLPVAPRQADLREPEALAAALAGTSQVVSTAHARHSAAILAAAPAGASFVLLGSTRRFSRWPDTHGEGVRAGEAAFLASGRDGVMLHPTMIYGAQGEDNVRRLASLLGRLPVWPLPAGGRNLVQPIHQEDVTRAVLAALSRRWEGPHSLVIAGPEAVTYRAFAAAVALAAGVPVRPVVPLPATLLQRLAPLARRIPGLPRVSASEIRRLTEDKAFDITPMIACLSIETLPLREGLRRTFPK